MSQYNYYSKSLPKFSFFHTMSEPVHSLEQFVAEQEPDPWRLYHLGSNKTVCVPHPEVC